MDASVAPNIHSNKASTVAIASGPMGMATSLRRSVSTTMCMNARPLDPAVTMVRVVIVVLALLAADKDL